ncbi:MAG: glycolate oxidase subunit GlcF [SAR324 cluster bacterium]|nr:glycolate oxidase subunit GlcF [SAR324 cluster bacterium]
MQTSITERQARHPDAQIAEDILRTCVHCGFCNATCPTYQLRGVEMEGPRGRIYLIKALLEDQISHSDSVVDHLDNCLSCLACETTCPSGVRYSHLIDSARSRIEEQHERSFSGRMQRKLLAKLLPNPKLFRTALRLGQMAKPFAFLMPSMQREMLARIPYRIPRPSRLDRPGVREAEGKRRARVSLLTGCAQKVMGPAINDATLRLLARLGCEVVLPAGLGCCGALVYHMGNHEDSLPAMKQNIDRWHAEMENGGLDHIVINTSGCGVVVKDYGHIFRNDPAYAEKAARVSSITRDVSEVVSQLGLGSRAAASTSGMRVAYHDACSLQHGQKVRAEPRALLKVAGFEVLEIPDGHLCCGSAGTYNLLKPGTAGELGRMKAEAVASVEPQVVAMGNIGCMEQIAAYLPIPVVHTVQLLDWATGGPKPRGIP